MSPCSTRNGEYMQSKNCSIIQIMHAHARTHAHTHRHTNRVVDWMPCSLSFIHLLSRPKQQPRHHNPLIIQNPFYRNQLPQEKDNFTYAFVYIYNLCASVREKPCKDDDNVDDNKVQPFNTGDWIVLWRHGCMLAEPLYRSLQFLIQNACGW